MDRRSLMLVAAALLLALGCEREEPRARHFTRAEPVSSSDAGASPAPPPAGAVPFPFPRVATSAKPGDFVLAPSRSWIDEAFAKGGESQTFIYYGAWLQTPGPWESVLKTLPGQAERVPNAMILSVGSGGTAEPGQIVLTAWASGSGLQRAMVVEGGTPRRPRVRYLDLELGNPSGYGQKDDELPENTFRVLSKPGELGTTLACKDGRRFTRWVLIAQADNKLLGLGFAGKMRVLGRADCTNLPLSPKLTVAQKLFVPVAGVFTEAKVTKLDAKVGRVSAKYELGSGVKEESFSFTNVATEL